MGSATFANKAAISNERTGELEQSARFAQMHESEVKMFDSDDRLIRFQDQKTREFLRQAEKDRLCAEARPRKKGQAAHIARKIVHSFGHALLSAGTRLDNLAPHEQSLAQE